MNYPYEAAGNGHGKGDSMWKKKKKNEMKMNTSSFRTEIKTIGNILSKVSARCNEDIGSF